MKKILRLMTAFILMVIMLNIVPFSISSVNAVNISDIQAEFEDFFLSFPDIYETTYKQIEFEKVKQEVEDSIIEYINERDLIVDDFKIKVEIYPVNTMNITVGYYTDEVKNAALIIGEKKYIAVKYSNDNAKDTSAEEKINDMVEQIVPVIGEFELDENYDERLRAYSVEEVLNNKTGLDLQIIDLNNDNDISGVFYKMRVISVAIGYKDYVYYMGNAAILQSMPIITLPDTLEASNDVYLEYATQRVKDYLDNNNTFNFELVSVVYDEDALNEIDVTLKSTATSLEVTHSENIKLTNMKTIKKGDINADGLVDSADAAVVLNLYKYNNATESYIELGDMDDNGMLDSADAAMILNAFKYNL